MIAMLQWADKYNGARMLDGILCEYISVDPLSDKYPSMSHYVYCAGNPLRYTDPTGMYLVDEKGRRVTYNGSTGIWSKNATNDIKVIGNAMMQTKTGTSLLMDMVNVNYPISMEIKNFRNGIDTNYELGKTDINWVKRDYIRNNKVVSSVISIGNVKIEIYLDQIKRELHNIRQYNVGKEMYKDVGLTVEQIIGTVGVHEGTHAMDPLRDANRESRAEENEKKAIEELKQQEQHDDI